MAKNIYGVDPDGEITPLKVRDAIIKCFEKAHANVLESMKEIENFESDKDFKEMKQLNVKFLIKAKLKEVGGSYNNPTKEDLVKLCDRLADFASNFRGQEKIHKHYNEIMQLIEKL